MKKYITPAWTVKSFYVKERLLMGSEIDTEITDGGAVKDSSADWGDDSNEDAIWQEW
ncbi:MAG: hypothetical protein MJZ60_05690 [Bacteroidaceae bacterium]|nr:hypothetical protein [Bacteroidaceae bacterium]